MTTGPDYQEDRIRGIVAVLLASVIWGTTGTAATFAPEVGAAAIGAAAMGIGGLLQAAMAGRGILAMRPRLGRDWRLLLAGGLAVAIYPLAFYGSMRLAGVTVGTVVSLGSAPLLSALIEYLLEGRRVSRRWLLGAVPGLAGILLLGLAEGGGAPHAPGTGGAPDNGFALGVGLGLVAGLTYALYSWTARRMMQGGLRARVAMGATFGIGGLLLMPVLVMTGGPFLASGSAALVGLYMALVPMFLGYLCFGYGLARIPASMATTLTLTEPVVAALLAVLIVGERLPPAGWIGVGLIGLCMVVISLPARRG